jgi:hypothetical protein
MRGALLRPAPTRLPSRKYVLPVVSSRSGPTKTCRDALLGASQKPNEAKRRAFRRAHCRASRQVACRDSFQLLPKCVNHLLILLLQFAVPRFVSCKVSPAQQSLCHSFSAPFSQLYSWLPLTSRRVRPDESLTRCPTRSQPKSPTKSNVGLFVGLIVGLHVRQLVGIHSSSSPRFC